MRTAAVLLLASFGLAGCSSLPKPISNPAGVSLPQLLQAIQCDFAGIYDRPPETSGVLRDWVAGAALDLKVTDTASADPGLKLKPGAGISLVLPGTMSVANTGVRQLEMTVVTRLWELDPEEELGSRLRAECPPEMGNNTLGLGATLREIATAIANGGSVSTLKVLILTVEFTADRSVGGGISFETEYLEGGIDKSEIGRKAENSVIVKFDKRAAAPADGEPTESFVEDDVEERLVRELQELTKEPDIVLKPGDTLVVQ